MLTGLALLALTGCTENKSVVGKSEGYVTPDVARRPPYRCLKDYWGLKVVSTVQSTNSVTGEAFMAKTDHYLCVTDVVAYKYPTGVSYP